MFTVLRQTMRKRLQAKLNEVKAELRRRMHDPIPEVGQWLRSVVEWALPLLRRAHEQPGAVRLPVPGGLALASRAVAAQPDRPRPLGPDAAADRPLAASGPRSIILIPCAAWASSPKARAGCGKAARPDPWRGSWATMIPTPT